MMITSAVVNDIKKWQAPLLYLCKYWWDLCIWETQKTLKIHSALYVNMALDLRALIAHMSKTFTQVAPVSQSRRPMCRGCMLDAAVQFHPVALRCLSFPVSRPHFLLNPSAVLSIKGKKAPKYL